MLWLDAAEGYRSRAEPGKPLKDFLYGDTEVVQKVLTSDLWEEVATFIAGFMRFKECFHELEFQSNDGLRVMLIEPPAEPPRDRLALLTSRTRPRQAMLTIGPEGGWSEYELNRARVKGWETLTLGSRTLRADAAPVVAIAVLLYVWGEL